MHGRAVRKRALELCALGHPYAEIARQLGVSRAAVREWARDPTAAAAACDRRLCFACARSACPAPATYAYLLGQYLGDGYLVTTARIPRLRIACADRYPNIAAEVDAAMHEISGNVPGAVARVGCSDRYSYWLHWPCLFPQHGPGRKHERPIAFVPWQQAIVAAHPWPLIRGLIHSDGSRGMNRIVIRGKQYTYPRYFFSNESRDILTIAGDALDRVGVQWRYNRPNSISIARRGSVELMDQYVGPKS